MRRYSQLMCKEDTLSYMETCLSDFTAVLADKNVNVKGFLHPITL